MTKRRHRQYVTCRHCRRASQRHEGRGLCRACHGRAGDAGWPQEGPPAPVPPEVSGMRGAKHLIEEKARRLEDFADLDSWGADYREAADRLEVSPSTIFRYRRALAAGPLQLRIPDLEKAS